MDTEDCTSDKICVTAEHLPHMLSLARKHALKCPTRVGNDCPIAWQDTLNKDPCNIEHQRCYYNSYCCPMCGDDAFAKCGYLHESICMDGKLNITNHFFIHNLNSKVYGI